MTSSVAAAPLCAGRRRNAKNLVGRAGFEPTKAYATLDELVQQAPLVRFRALTLVTARVLRAAGLRLEPTGRNPRHYTVSFDDLDDGVARLCRCEHRVMLNPYHDA